MAKAIEDRVSEGGNPKALRRENRLMCPNPRVLDRSILSPVILGPRIVVPLAPDLAILGPSILALTILALAILGPSILVPVMFGVK